MSVKMTYLQGANGFKDTMAEHVFANTRFLLKNEEWNKG